MKRRFLPVFLLMTVFIGCGGSYDAEKRYWHASREHAATLKDPAGAEEGRFDAAVAALRGIVSRYPAWEQSPDLQFLVGQMYGMRKQYARAREELNRVVVDFPQRSELCARALFGIGAMHEKQGEWKSALEQYRLVLDRYPMTITGLQIPLYIANRYREQRLQEEAERAYSLAVNQYTNLIEVNPYSKQVPVLQYLLIASYAWQDKWEEAVASLERLARKHPASEASPVALYRSAMIYQQVLKRPAKAVAVYREIIANYPRSRLGKNARLEIGNLSLFQGDIEQAQSEFNEIFEKYPEDASLCAVAQLAVASGYAKAGRWDDALKEYQELLANYPDSLEALQAPLLIARHYQKENRAAELGKSLDDAMGYYRRVIARKPGVRLEAAAQEYLAGVYSMQNRWSEAIGALGVLRNKYPRDPRSEIALLTMGVIYQEELKDPRKAAELYLRFIQEYPNHSMAGVAREILGHLQAQGRAR